jgi:GntR family transcriptional regulator/MocR family aminotransferase
VLPAELVEPMVVARTLLDGHTNRIMQLTLARFIDAGHFGAHVKTMRRVYRGRLEALQEGLKKNLAGMVHMYVPNGGLQMPCLLDEDVDESSTIGRAARAGIDLPGLSRLYHTPPPRGGWLMGFAAFTPDEIKTASQRLAKALVN